MFEQRREPLLPRHTFAWRVVWHVALASALVAAALGIGVLGYHRFEGLDWIDALLNASMILGGMGPVDTLRTPSGKYFASFYALFSGLLFVGAASIIVAPFVHRIMHRLQIDDEE
ncbi:MAG: hypothetical protein DWH79_05455 [Planctomycetota bacterium]|nr:MAG: hypothetical protein DWH79_05455 [Planctomycetota bacterium]